MDWGRAKNIILVVLILLNLFLFINIINVKEIFTGKHQRNVKQALETEGVIVSCSIPSPNPVGRISYAERDDAALSKMIAQLTGLPVDGATSPHGHSWEAGGRKLSFYENSFVFVDGNSEYQLPVDDIKKLDRELKAWIKSNGVSAEPFVLDRLVKNNNIYTAEYVRRFKNLPLYSQKITFTITDNKLTKVEGSLNALSDVKASKAADEVVAANIVLLTGKEKVKGIVKSIELGYLNLNNDDLYDTPVWRVTLENGARVWFNAYTGEWLKSG